MTNLSGCKFGGMIFYVVWACPFAAFRPLPELVEGNGRGRRLRVGPLWARRFLSLSKGCPPRPAAIPPTPCATRVASTTLSRRVFLTGVGP